MIDVRRRLFELLDELSPAVRIGQLWLQQWNKVVDHEAEADTPPFLDSGQSCGVAALAPEISETDDGVVRLAG